MKFDNTDDNQTLPAGDTDESNKTMSLLGGVAGPDGADGGDLDLASIDSPKRGLSRGTMLLLVVIVLGAGSLYLMRVTKTDMGKGLRSDVEAKIEQALAKLTHPDAMSSDDPLRSENLSSLLGDTDSVLAMFTSDPTRNQVPVEFVKKNPFLLPLTKKETPVDTGPTADTSEAQRQAELERLRKKLQAEALTLRLQTVIGGARPAAIINGDVLQPGQTIGSFTVAKINSLSVELKADGFEFELKMEERNAPKIKR